MSQTPIVENMFIYLLYDPDDSRYCNMVSQLNSLNWNVTIILYKRVTQEKIEILKTEYLHYLAIKNIRDKKNSPLMIQSDFILKRDFTHLTVWEDISRRPNTIAMIIEDYVQINNIELFAFYIRQVVKSHYNFKNQNSYSPLSITLFDAELLFDQNENLFDQTEIENVNNEFLGLECYITNDKTCEYLLDDNLTLVYRLDVQLGRLFRGKDRASRNWRYHTPSNNEYILYCSNYKIKCIDHLQHENRFIRFTNVDELYKCFNILPKNICILIYKYLYKVDSNNTLDNLYYKQIDNLCLKNEINDHLNSLRDT